MKYIVKYLLWGDDAHQVFDHLDHAMNFIQNGLHDEANSGFSLYQRLDIRFLVEIA